MSKFTPWTQEQAEKWAEEYFGEDGPGYIGTQTFLAGLAKAAEMIEASPLVRAWNGGTSPLGPHVQWELESWGDGQWEAKLVGVRPIYEEPSDDQA